MKPTPPFGTTLIVSAATAAAILDRYGIDLAELPETTNNKTTVSDTIPCPPSWESEPWEPEAPWVSEREDGGLE
jgi:hypothetical protein